MNAYNYEILENTKKNKNKYFKLVEGEGSSSDFTYKLHLYNNQYREVTIVSDSSFNNIKNKQTISFIVKNVVTFTWKVASIDIYYSLDKEGNKLLLEYWLYHTFLPILFTIGDFYYILHAGAVEIEKKPVLFVADSFGGKSTLTDFFLKKGHTMISDDKVATYEKDDKVFSIPSYPYHRPYRKMEDLGVFVKNFTKEEKIIDSIFHLVKGEKDSEIEISKIKGIEKFKVLRYATDIDIPVNKASRFKKLVNIANKVDIYNISIPWDLDRLEEVYQTIVNFVKNKKVNS